MEEEREPLIELDEDVEKHYWQYLPEFTEKIYPLFKAHGFSLPEAMSFWMFNKIHCTLVDIKELLTEDYSNG